MLKKLLAKLSNRPHHTLREHTVGPYKILLPQGHKLDYFQSKFPRYDYALGEITRIIHHHYPSLTAIDIGANIGDSAALICKHQKVPLLCIEGVPEYVTILKKNAQRIGNNVIIEPSFVGTGKEFLPKKIEPKRGSYSLVQGKGIYSSAKTKTLGEILENHRDFTHCKLFKIDTDGFDFKIILHSIDEMTKMKPILFWEYDLSLDKECYSDSLTTIKHLYDIGYRFFIVYDNFGNYLITIDNPDKFYDLNIFLLSNQYNTRIIHYFDVCAIHREDRLIAEEIKRFEQGVVPIKM